jgi:predicted phage tail protein
MNSINHLRRGLLAVVVAAASVVGGVGGITRADNAAAATPLSAAFTATTHAPADGALTAVTAPRAPRSPTATPRNTAVKLAWLRPSSNGGANINKYRVQRATSKTGPWKTIAKPTVRRYRATGLTNGKRYWFRVAAHNAAGWSNPSKLVTAVPRTVPTAPRSPTATPGNTVVKLAWLAPASNGGTKIDKYRVQRATSSGGPWTTIAAPTTRSHTAGGLTNGKKYYFRVAAHNAAGWSAPTKVVSAVPYTVPSAPLSPVATPGNSSVTLSWSKPSSNGGAAIDYTVQAPNFGVWTDIASTTELTYTVTQLYNGTPYDFRIVAHNAAGSGAPSTAVKAVPFTSPGAPLKLTATSGKDWINLTWNPPFGDGGRPVQSYLIYRSTSLNGSYSQVKSTQNLSYLDPGLAPGTVYYYTVYACNVAGCGPYSNIVYANVPTLPSKPATCTATQLYGAGSDWVRVQWTPPVSNGGAPILNYKIQLTDWSATVHATAQPPGNVITWDIYMPADSGATEQNGIYYYHTLVTAQNVAGTSPTCGNGFTMKP